MRTDNKNSWVYWDWIKRQIKSLVKPHQLSHKGKIWINDFSLWLSVSVSLFIIKPLFEYQIRHNYCCWPWNSLNAMNKDSTSFILTLFNEINCIIKYAFNIFDCMVFQMVPFVLKCAFMIILAYVSTAVNNVRDPIVK